MPKDMNLAYIAHNGHNISGVTNLQSTTNDLINVQNVTASVVNKPKKIKKRSSIRRGRNVSIKHAKSLMPQRPKSKLPSRNFNMSQNFLADFNIQSQQVKNALDSKRARKVVSQAASPKKINFINIDFKIPDINKDHANNIFNTNLLKHKRTDGKALFHKILKRQKFNFDRTPVNYEKFVKYVANKPVTDSQICDK